VTVGALDIGQLLQSAGPSAALLVVVIVLVWLWLRAERRADRADQRTERVQTLLDKERERNAGQADNERERRWKAEDAAARARRRKGGDVDAS
jgi:uncharacterized protein (TIGR03382 family)